MSNIIPFPGPEPRDQDRTEARVVLPPTRASKRVPGKELVPQVFEGEIVDDPDEPRDRPVPVDPPLVPAVGPVGDREVQLRPLVPDWLADPVQRRSAARWWVRAKTHAATYHGLRVPLYYGRLSAAAPRGAGRVVAGATRWALDLETAEMVRGARGEPKAALGLVVRRDQHQAVRGTIVLVAALVLAVLMFVAVRTGLWWLLVLAGLPLLGVVGRQRDKPIVTAAVVKPSEKPLRAEMVEAALRDIGEVGPKEKVDFIAPGVHVDGPGWRVDLDLPGDSTATKVMGKREDLAGALRRPLGAVWPGPDHDAHPGRLVLWVGRQAMEKARPPLWPLAKTGTADLFKPVPFGYDQRGRIVSLTLMEANLLIGSVPGAGKTYALRDALLDAALDPRVELRTFEFKGTGDLAPFQPIAHHYGSGPSNETLEQCMASLREVYDLLETRAKTIDEIAARDRALCPENKVTPELASQRRLKLWPIVVAIDECQELYSHPDYKEEAERISLAIIKRGRALSIILLLSTQRPDAQSLPKGISANMTIRFCLRVEGHVENDMVLGSGKHRNGFRATQFTTNQKGMGWLAGAADEPQIVRTFKIDGPEAEKIVLRAKAAREAAGTLSGYAVGEQEFDAGPDTSLLHDVLQVMEPTEDAVHSVELCRRLAEAWSQYDGWNERTLGAAAKAAGVRTKQVKIGGVNLFGIKREWILDALEEPRAD